MTATSCTALRYHSSPLANLSAVLCFCPFEERKTNFFLFCFFICYGSSASVAQMSEEKEGAPVREIIEIPLYTEEAPEEASAEPQGENNPRFETDIPTLLERLRQKAEREGRDAAAEDSGADDFEEDTEEGEANASFSIVSLGNAFAKMLQKQKQNDYQWLESTQRSAADTEMWKVQAGADETTANGIVTCFTSTLLILVCFGSFGFIHHLFSCS